MNREVGHFSEYATSQELTQLSKSSKGKVNANTGRLTCEADATPNNRTREPFIRIVSYRVGGKASKPTAFVPETIVNESRPVPLAASPQLLLWCIHKARRAEGQHAAPNSIARVSASRHGHFAFAKGFAPDLVLGAGASPPRPLVLEGRSFPTNRFACACEEL